MGVNIKFIKLEEEISDENSVENTKDGRVRRGNRSRELIASAMVALVDEGNPKPNAKAISDRAGVSLRLVFHHFEDMESLYEAGAQLQVKRHWNQITRISTDLPLDNRINEFVAQRSTVYEGIGPVRRATAALDLTSEFMSEMRVQVKFQLRKHAEETFKPELSRAKNREQILDAIEILGSFEAWDVQRRFNTRSKEETSLLIENVLRLLLNCNLE